MNTPTELSMGEKLRGCLLGGAVGDALGAPVEFLSIAEIKARFGPDGIQDYAPAYGRLGAITDDTQMTLFTAEGLLRAYVRAGIRGMVSVTSVVSHAYLRWLWTQGIQSEAKPQPEHVRGWLWGIKELHSQRAPGRTCISAVKALTHFTDQRADNDSKGAGGIMRVAPVAMMFAGQPDEAREVFHFGMETAWLTHGHPSGFLSAAAFAVILHAVLCNEPLVEGIDRARQFLIQEEGHEETVAALDKAVSLAGSKLAHEAAIGQLGEAWVGEEALGIAVYCTLKASNFQHGVLMAINHEGDSDTTGSLVGQLLGAFYGEAGIPERWLTPLEIRDTITQLANDIEQHWRWNLDYMSDGYDAGVVERYPGG